MALTSGAISAVDGGDDQILKALLGWLPRRLGEALQVWALRDQGKERDKAAVRFTRNPGSLVRALEKLDADQQQVGRVTRSTAPLWIEFPKHALGGSGSRATRGSRTSCSSTSASTASARWRPCRPRSPRRRTRRRSPEPEIVGR